MTEQAENIQRVNSQIAGHVTAFMKGHIDKDFHCDELRKYVYDRVGGYIAPGSPDRILRLLRQQGVVDYAVINRRKSLYRSLSVEMQGRLF